MEEYGLLIKLPSSCEVLVVEWGAAGHGGAGEQNAASRTALSWELGALRKSSPTPQVRPHALVRRTAFPLRLDPALRIRGCTVPPTSAPCLSTPPPTRAFGSRRVPRGSLPRITCELEDEPVLGAVHAHWKSR